MSVVLPTKESEKLLNQLSSNYRINYNYKLPPSLFTYFRNGFSAYKDSYSVVGRLLLWNFLFFRHYNGGNFKDE